MKWFSASMIFALLLTACTETKVYDKHQHTSFMGWDKNDTLFFNVPPLHNEGNYQSQLSMRINNAFPFMNITLIVEQTVFPRYYKTIDTLHCNLIDTNGVAKGNGISQYQYSFKINNQRLNQHDSLHIAVRHDMKRKILPGISNIGIQLTKEQ